MKRFVPIALAALFLLGIASAQNIPLIEVFGGYSYLRFSMPANSGYTLFSSTSAQNLTLNGWDVSGSVGLLHSLAAEVDVSGHSVSNCGDNNEPTPLNCSNLSFLVGPRFNIGNRSRRITGFAHVLFGRDRMDIPEPSSTTAPVSDVSKAFAGGAGADVWVSRHIGVQLGPFDYVWTHHLNADQLSSQNNVRVGLGIVGRFGGESASSAPTPSREPSAGSRRARRESQTTRTVAAPQPAGVVVVPGRGLSIPALGLLVAPQEFDGAKIVEIVPGGVAEMASLKAGDLVRSVDGKAVKTPMELAAELSDKSGKVRIGILRGDVATETLILLSGR